MAGSAAQLTIELTLNDHNVPLLKTENLYICYNARWVAIF